MKENLLASAIGYGRFALYTLESFPLLYARKWFGKTLAVDPAPPEDQWKQLLTMAQSLIEKDAENIQKGVYSLSLLYPEDPVVHAKRYFEIVVDSVAAARRSLNNQHKSFSEGAQQKGEGLPDYYMRNFHFQTDGYLSEKSAEIYSHQTEILFKGTISLMRRVLMAPMIEHILQQKRTVRVLELGSGAGEATEILLRSCHNVEVVSIDLSEPYLELSQEKFADFGNWHFKKAAAEDFQSPGDFDVVFSAFLFHELPRMIRENILERCKENLAPGGVMWHIDSLQLDDDEKMNWALIQFPKNFHEPFYADYIKNPLIAPEGMTAMSCDSAFLAKSFFSKRND